MITTLTIQKPVLKASDIFVIGPRLLAAVGTKHFQTKIFLNI